MMDVQTTGEAYIPQRRTSSASKHYVSSLSSFLWVIFANLDLDLHSRCKSGSGPSRQKSMRIHADPDPQHWYKDKETK
jgi:hypothetical protein